MDSLETQMDILDRLYYESDYMYYVLAQGCGLSETAYWIMYAVQMRGGSVPQRDLCEYYSYSRQTVNSAVKSLEARGLVELSFLPGSKKSKNVCATAKGREFCEEKIVPAMQVERRAFLALEPNEQAELVRLAKKYTLLIKEQMSLGIQGGEAHEM